MAVTQIGTANLAEYFSSDAYIKRPKKGFVTTLGQEMPQLMYGPTNYFDLSADTNGKFVGESESKDGEGIATPLRQVRTEKIVYDQRISVEAYNQLGENGGLSGFLQSLVSKFMGRDFERDLDKLALYGKTSASGTHVLDDYITKTGSAILVPATGTSGTAIDTDLATAVGSVDTDGIALSGPTAAALAKINTNGVQKYPDLGTFGLAASSVGGVQAAISKAIGSMGTEKLVAGDFNAVRWGVVSDSPIKLLDSGDPDGQGDLGNLNQYLIRLEIFFGLGLASHSALAYVADATTTTTTTTTTV